MWFPCCECIVEVGVPSTNGVLLPPELTVDETLPVISMFSACWDEKGEDCVSKAESDIWVTANLPVAFSVNWSLSLDVIELTGASMRSTENRDLVGLAVDELGPVSVTEEIENLPA